MKLNKISRFVLTSVLAASLLACSKSEPKPLVADKVWTTYPTMKVIKEVRGGFKPSKDWKECIDKDMKKRKNNKV